MKFRSPDDQKMHLRHSFLVQKHSLYVVDKHNFFCEYQLRIPPFCHVCLYFLCLQLQQFLLEFWSFMVSFEEKLTRKLQTTFLYACLEVTKSKSKKFLLKKICMKRLSFITQSKIEFLLLFTGCGKQPVNCSCHFHKCFNNFHLSKILPSNIFTETCVP